MANSKISALASATTPLAGTETLPIVQSGVTTKVTVANLTAGRSVQTTSLAAVTTTSSGASTTAWGTGNSTFGPNATSPTGSALGVGYNTGTNVSEIISLAPNVAWRKMALFSGGLDINSSNGSTAASFDTSGNQTLSTGNLIQGTAAKGINFTANTPTAGKTSQLLNWYEEGTWTPVASGDSGSLTSYTSNGRYTRVGRQVFLQGVVTLTNVGTAGGRMVINGFPFTIASGSLGPNGTCREQAATGVMYFFFGADGGTNGYVATTIGGNILWINSYSYAFNMTYSV